MAFSKMFWIQGSPPTPISASWDYWSTAVGWNHPLITFTDSSYEVYKTYDKIAYYCLVWMKDITGTTYLSEAFLSMDELATYNNFSPSSRGYHIDFYDDLGNVWWFSGLGMKFHATPSDAGYVLNTESTAYNDYDSNTKYDVARNLLSKVYAIPFHEDYQVGQTYRIPACGDVRKTIRKIVGWQLMENVDKYSASPSFYKIYSDNIESIISTMLSEIQTYGNENGVIIAEATTMSTAADPGIYLLVQHGHYSQAGGSKINYLDKATMTRKIEPTDTYSYNFSSYELEYLYDWGDGEVSDSYYYDWDFMEKTTWFYMNQDGTYTIHTEDAGWSSQWAVNAFIGLYSGTFITNLGIDL